jgi:phage terminase small subunit
MSLDNRNGNGRLTPKQSAFIEEYFVDFNATRAAQRAGYSGDDNTLAATGSRLLRNDKIANRVSQRLSESAMSADEVLARLAEIARGAHGEYLLESGKVDFAQLIEDGNGHLIKSIRETQYGLSIEFCDMQRALVDIGKHHGLFVERREITGAGGGPLDVNVTDARNELDRRLSDIVARTSQANVPGELE